MNHRGYIGLDPSIVMPDPAAAAIAAERSAGRDLLLVRRSLLQWMYEMLRYGEWFDTDTEGTELPDIPGEYCPRCMCPKSEGHECGCEWQAAIAALEEALR